MGAEFSHLNIANVHEVVACDLKDVLILYEELMDQRAELKGVNLELEEEGKQDEEERKESSKHEGDNVNHESTKLGEQQSHHTHTIEEGNENEENHVDKQNVEVEDTGVGEESIAKQSMSSEVSEVDLDIPFQAPQFYVARADFSIAMDELPDVFSGYRKEDISLFTDIYMRMDDLGTDNVSFKDIIILFVD